MTPDAFARIEDLYWLVESGAHVADATSRLHVSADALEKFCDRYDIYPVWQRLKHRGHKCNDSCPILLPPLPPIPEPPEDTMTDTITDLIGRGQDHASKRVQNAADRTEEAVEKLRELLDAEDAKVEARAEVERLERELAEAKARLRGGTAQPAATRVDSKQIRVWARSKKLDCPAYGRIPKRIVEAYDKAHRRAA